MTDQEIIQLFKEGHRQKAFSKLYGEWPKAKKLVMKMGGNVADARDIFHDALFILYKKLHTEHFVLQGTLNGFLYHTSRILCLEKLRKESRSIRIDTEMHLTEEETDYQEIENKSRLAQLAFDELAEKCREILHLFYWEKRSMGFIANRLSLKSEQAAKTQKYKCLETARNTYKSLAGKEGLL